MSKRASKAAAAQVPFSNGLYSVEGRLFRTRAEAADYCKANRIPAWKIGLHPPTSVVQAGDLDPVKLSLNPGWTLRVFFDGPVPLLLLEHAEAAHAFSVPMSDLVDLVSSVKARIRELAKVSP